ncbi:unnamed protein product [Ilex paraguariensis]|uniref:Uncharacterized protein n=1 Tax=Ilex paraguariensis TaxID=185542 RepID=A0ABC8R8S8_9AQUA
MDDESDSFEFSSDSESSSDSNESDESALSSDETERRVARTNQLPYISTVRDEFGYSQDYFEFLDLVRDEFGYNSQEYFEFYQLIQNHVEQRIDIMQVISRVKVLFSEHQELLVAFNTFLPIGYHILVRQNTSDPESFIEAALNFVNKVKTRTLPDRRRYYSFLNIIKGFRTNFIEAYQEICAFFHDMPDLLDEFHYFFPD